MSDHVARSYLLVSLAFLLPAGGYLAALPEPVVPSAVAASQPAPQTAALDPFPERRYVTPIGEDARFWRRAPVRAAEAQPASLSVAAPRAAPPR